MNNWLRRICNPLGRDFRQIANPLERATPLELLGYSAGAGGAFDHLRDRSIYY